MSKKPSLAQALKKVENRAPNPEPIVKTPKKKEEEKKSATNTSTLPPSREGKKAITGHFDPSVSKQLKMIGIEHDKTVQMLLSEALNDLFVKYGKSSIA